MWETPFCQQLDVFEASRDSILNKPKTKQTNKKTHEQIINNNYIQKEMLHNDSKGEKHDYTCNRPNGTCFRVEVDW